MRQHISSRGRLCCACCRKVPCLLSADNYDWCIVPDSGYDIIVFAGVAVIISCLFRGKFSNLMILIAGKCVENCLSSSKRCYT